MWAHQRPILAATVATELVVAPAHAGIGLGGTAVGYFEPEPEPARATSRRPTAPAAAATASAEPEQPNGAYQDGRLEQQLRQWGQPKSDGPAKPYLGQLIVA